MKKIVNVIKSRIQKTQDQLNGENTSGEYKSGYVFSDIYRNSLITLNNERRYILSLIEDFNKLNNTNKK